MINKINIVPRWIIFVIDLGVTTTALLLAFIVKQNLTLVGVNWENLVTTIAIMLIVNAFVFTTIKTYAGIVRYTGMQDALRIAVSVMVSSVVLYLLSIISSPIQDSLVLNNVVIIVYATFSFLALLTYRVAVKFGFAYLRSYKMKRKTVVIFGAGEAGVATKRVLEHDGQNHISIVAFVDDDRKKNKKALDGVRIISFNDLAALAAEEPIDELIIASFTITAKRKNELVDFCLNHDIKVLVVPPYSNWTEGSFSSRQLRSINIEELLERDPIHINNNQIRAQIKGKRVLVTGAAGSIGSEIVRQLMHYSPELIVLCDQAETPLHTLELELQETGKSVNCISYLASITNEARMRQLFTSFKPHYVYHAAAYKHVPMMELCPTEAVRNNVLGTQLIANLANEYGVERFVMVSTDKAVNPTNVMGASKRLAEIYVQGLSKHHTNTKYITTRFGNVLGSNGSVINRFKQQIEKGGPITVTHPNITRYFMTIPEACQLVLEAGSMGNGGEIFVFDMGQPVAIADLAKKMIRLYGLIPNIDIDIVYSGLRPGEKLYEELLNDGENTGNTYHDKIMIAKVREVEFVEVSKHFTELCSLVSSEESDMYLVAKMKEMVPEFVSNNSVFEKLDMGGKVVGMD
ncbi:MAG: polysaccharide biosynthesis protein [Bacteroidetes bacterium]|nr:polysaccharide biosynthesis protein [Bacteroidota bacterium]